MLGCHQRSHQNTRAISHHDLQNVRGYPILPLFLRAPFCEKSDHPNPAQISDESVRGEMWNVCLQGYIGRTQLSHLSRSLSAFICEKDEDLGRIPKFGIVAAVSRNGVIGLDGRLPWSLPADRELFETLTRGQMLIVGKSTFFEDSSLCHIQHTRSCVVVSKSMDEQWLRDHRTLVPNTALHLARSFEGALELAKEASEMNRENDSFSETKLSCWVAGGRGIYERALKHKSASELHLSRICLDVDTRWADKVVRFPESELWMHHFKEVQKTFVETRAEHPNFNYTRFARVSEDSEHC